MGFLRKSANTNWISCPLQILPDLNEPRRLVWFHTFQKLSEIEAAKKIKKKQRREVVDEKISRFQDIPVTQAQGDTGTIDAVSRLIPSTQLGKDFNVFLVQRLTAAREAQERHEREKKREEKRFLKKLLATAQAMKDGTNAAFDAAGEDLNMNLIILCATNRVA